MSQIETKDVVAGIGERIKQAREFARMTQAGLAAHLEISRTAVTQWESGVTFPSYDKLIDIAKLFHVGPEYLAFNISRQVEYKLPDDVIKLPVVHFDNRTDRIHTFAHYLSKKFVTDTLRLADAGDLYVYQIETAAFEPRISPGDHLIVDGNPAQLSGYGLSLIWNGYNAQVVEITSNLGRPGFVRVFMTAAGSAENARHFDVDFADLNVLGRVCGRVGRAL
ncbi:helix-turn-helix transcriptional regulator [Phyllobacterium sp. UNC302MFCol5.2]|uniref:helix-turn-helix domain-containing protein n=1 Tax=Phyllobacterium sp. UNC302MFCol5.2 TaxID=1449065 RepID=UPI00056A9BAF|nr:helix-turn-helix transcriptional regulator [Phyllobacterium sp. UNC302MFCol5.2]